MATEIFNERVIAVARRLQEPQVGLDANAWLAGTNPHDRYSPSLVAGYVNAAVREEVQRQLQNAGDLFSEVMPEMVKTLSALALVGGEVTLPLDFLHPLGMWISGGARFTFLEGTLVDGALSGQDAAAKGTATEPRYYVEGNKVKALGLTAGVVNLRYVILHQDIAVDLSVAGWGKWLVASDGAYTAATRVLSGTLDKALAATDVGKAVMFRTAQKVYHARIDGISGVHSVLGGTDLPAANVAAGGILAILISDRNGSDGDLKLRSHWNTAIEEFAVQLGILDARRGLLKGAT